MSWKESDRVSQRREILDLVKVFGANITQLCMRFGISRKTGYKWINRAQEQVAQKTCREGQGIRQDKPLEAIKRRARRTGESPIYSKR